MEIRDFVPSHIPTVKVHWHRSYLYNAKVGRHEISKINGLVHQTRVLKIKYFLVLHM